MPTKRGGRRPGPRRTPVRRRTARRRTTRRRRQRATARLGAGAAALLLAASWPTVRPHLLAVAAAGVAGALLWWLRRTDRLHRSGERRRREAEAVRAGQLSLAEVDSLSWQEFERYVAGLCRRDGCRDVVVTGGSGDLGADVTATLPDGRRLVIQCKHYAPHRYVPSGDMQKFLGTAWLHHRADVAVFAATCPFGKAALALAAEHRIVAVHRDLLGLWNTGTPLTALLGLGGAGQGGAAHRRRWRETYGRG